MYNLEIHICKSCEQLCEVNIFTKLPHLTIFEVIKEKQSEKFRPTNF